MDCDKVNKSKKKKHDKDKNKNNFLNKTLALNTKQHGNQAHKTAATTPRQSADGTNKPSGSKFKAKDGSLLEKMRQKLQGGQFRWLNEQLYTNESDNALALMKRNPELYQNYHEGFREQTKGWPLKPVDVVAKWLKSRSHSWEVADLGCGDAALSASVPQKVHSFDLVACAPGVIACNMAHLPLPNKSVDVAVFCLSLMGTDYGKFLIEASRVLKPNGWIWIAEVQSRFVDDNGKSVLKDFIQSVTEMGFELQRQDLKNSHFFILEFQGKKDRQRGRVGDVEWPSLRACQYKKR